MNTCLLSKQNGFSKFPPEKSALSRLGPGSFFPSLLPTRASTFYFFVFLRRISTGQEETHTPPPRVSKPLHAVGRRGGLHPLAIPHPQARGTMTCLGSLGSHRDQTKFGVSAVCVETSTPASWGTLRYMRWDETPDRDRPMATGCQGTHCFMSAAALGYSRLHSKPEMTPFYCLLLQVLENEWPKTWAGFPEGFLLLLCSAF